MGRPDFSDYVVHFTSDRPPLGIDHPNNKDDERLREIARLNAKQRLTLILRDRYIRTTPTPWLNVPACCFIECTWPSLMDNAHKYSPYAIGFSKKYIFNKGGGPAIYMRPDVYLDQQNFVTSKAQGYASSEKFAAFMVPFVRAYSEKEYKHTYWKDQDAVDHTREREWRMPAALEDFTNDDIAFIMVADNEDIVYFQDLRGDIPYDRFLVAKTCEQAERLLAAQVV